MSHSNPTLLEMKNIEKRFPGVHALNNVDFSLLRGEVHALLGENGAGKSTLMNVLGGIHRADAGDIFIEGERKEIRSVIDSQKLGISIIHQELVLVPHLTIAENIFLGREPTTVFGSVDKHKMIKDATEVMETVGLNFSPTEKLWKLSVAQQQLVEIAKAISTDAKILVMDEPTSSLMNKEVSTLFEIIRKLCQDGVGIVYISHRLSEIFKIAKRVTVLRDGQYIDTKCLCDSSPEELIMLMVGRKLQNYYTRSATKAGECVLEVDGLSQASTGLRNISFNLKKGEVLGFAGLVGAGRSELMRCIIGLEPFEKGKICLLGKPYSKYSCGESQRLGLVMVPEDRKSQGLILGNSVAFNITLSVLREFIRGIRMDRKKERQIVNSSISSLGIKTPTPKQKVRNLSGGNQQKVLMGKWLSTNPHIIILDEPTRGVDVGAKAEIYMIIDKLAHQGISVVLVSSELNEIINMCDRVIVMADRMITGVLEGEDISQEKIMAFATHVQEKAVAE